MELLEKSRQKRGKLLATGQVTSYGSGTGVDDGALQKGLPKPSAVYTVLDTGQYSLTTNITINGKTDVHSNACVFDNNTGLMWSQTVAATVGALGNGTLSFTTNGNGEGIFTYCAAANAASLSGHTDWRIPNVFELLSLMDFEQPTSMPDTTAFPVWSVSSFISSTTAPGTTTSVETVYFATSGTVATTAKTTRGACALVRGG
jgi:hypothetical protein